MKISFVNICKVYNEVISLHIINNIISMVDFVNSVFAKKIAMLEDNEVKEYIHILNLLHDCQLNKYRQH